VGLFLVEQHTALLRCLYPFAGVEEVNLQHLFDTELTERLFDAATARMLAGKAGRRTASRLSRQSGLTPIRRSSLASAVSSIRRSARTSLRAPEMEQFKDANCSYR
jgi:hypothetical protein